MTGKIMKKFSLVVFTLVMVLAILPSNVSAKEFESNNPDNWQWYKYANSVTNNSVTAVKLPSNFKETSLKWAHKLGDDWKNSPTPPIIDDKYLYSASNSRVVQLDKETGRETALSRTSRIPFYKGKNIGYATNPMLYAEGLFFVPIADGSIQAVNAKTLEPAWCSRPLGNQTISNISYGKINGKGYVFLGTWEDTCVDGTFFAVAIDNEGFSDSVESVKMVSPSGETGGYKNITYKIKEIAWSFTPSKDDKITEEHLNKPRGFYWSGAYVTDKYVAIGTDDGYNGGASLYTLNIKDGKVIDRITGIKGDIRTSISYDNGHLYFSTKNGHLHKCDVDGNGKLSNDSFIDVGGITSGTPVVYKDRIYIGISGKQPLDPSANHRFAVISNKGTLNKDSLIYTKPVPGYPQATPLISTAFENEDFNKDGKADGRVYIYFTYNNDSGGIHYFYDTPESKRAEISGKECELFIPEAGMKQYCISPISVGKDGVMYYKNDSGHIFAIERNPAYMDKLEIKANDGSLKMDKGSEIGEDFKAGKLNYTGTTKNCNSVSVKPLVVSGGKAIVNGKEFSGEDIKIDIDKAKKTEIKIVVQKEGYERKYSISLSPVGINAKLYDISVTSNGNVPPWQGKTNKPKSLSPVFSKDVNEYTSIVDKDMREKKSVRNIWITADDDKASVNVFPLENCFKYSEYNDKSKDDSLKVHAATSNNNGKKGYRVIIKPDEEKRDAKYKIEVTAENGQDKEIYFLTVGMQYHVGNISIEPMEVEIKVGEEIKLKEIITPENADEKAVTWSSDSDKIQISNDGKVKGIKAGIANVTVSSKDDSKLKATCKVVVKSNYKWVEENGSWHVEENGERKKGWFEDREIYPGWYFFDKTTGKMKTGWHYDESYKSWFYFAAGGKMATGWTEADGSWYYLENSGAMKTGWLQLGNSWYYLKSSGVMATGWEQVDGAWYYFENSGAMKTGWLQLGNIWYYLKSSGAMATDWEKVGGTWYRFASSGVWIS